MSLPSVSSSSCFTRAGVSNGADLIHLVLSQPFYKLVHCRPPDRVSPKPHPSLSKLVPKQSLTLFPPFTSDSHRTTDLTTIYATATFWTYGFSLLLLRTPLSRLILFSIFIAFTGVLIITYSGVEESQRHQQQGEEIGSGSGKVDDTAPTTTAEPPHRILGNLIMLFGAIVLGFYEVVYKLALPEGQGGLNNNTSEEEKDDDGLVRDVEPGYQAVSHGPDTLAISADQEESLRASTGHRRSTSDRSISSSHLEDDDGAYPLASPLDSGTRLTPRAPHPSHLSSRGRPKLPLALHANMLTSLIGVMTLLFFWIPIPLLHWVGWETFELPWGNWGNLFVVCGTGAVYVS